MDTMRHAPGAAPQEPDDRVAGAAAGRAARGASGRMWWGVVPVVVAVTLAAVATLVWWRGRALSGDPRARVAQALAAAGRGDLVAARAAVDDLRTAGAGDAARVVQGAILVTKGHALPALRSLEAAGGPAWLDPPRRLVAATAAQRLGRHADVEALLVPLVTADPDAVDAHRLLAASFYDVGAVAAAVHHLRETARLAPRDPRPHRLLGLMHSDYELFGEAIPCYEESLRRDPDQPDRQEILVELATCLVRQLRHDDALGVLEAAAAAPTVNLVRAECLLALGRRAEARGLVAAVLAAEPEHRAALALEGTIRLEDGDAAGAIEPLERAVAVDPHDYVATLTLARGLGQVGRDDEAATMRARADEIRDLRQRFADLHREAWEKPRDAAVRLRLAETAARLGRPDLERVWRDAAAAVGPAADAGSPEPGLDEAGPSGVGRPPAP